MVNSEPTVITTDRLWLVPLRPEALHAFLAGKRREVELSLGITIPQEFPAPADKGFLQVQLQRLEQAPDERDWMVRLMVLKDRPIAVGNIGFHGPPKIIGRAELGYTVFSAWRRQGFALEAIRAMLAWAASRGTASVFVSISPKNAPSLALAERLGFRQVGVQEDQVDGTELVFELNLRPVAP